MEPMSKQAKFSPEVRERAVRLVREQRSERPSLWAAVKSIAPMIGCTSQTLLGCVKQEQVESGERDGVTTSERERLKALEREVKELRRANEILKLASAFFRPGGTRPPFEVLKAFVERHRDAFVPSQHPNIRALHFILETAQNRVALADRHPPPMALNVMR